MDEVFFDKLSRNQKSVTSKVQEKVQLAFVKIVKFKTCARLTFILSFIPIHSFLNFGTWQREFRKFLGDRVMMN